MARTKCLMRDFTYLNRIYKSHQTNVWWTMKVFQQHCLDWVIFPTEYGFLYACYEVAITVLHIDGIKLFNLESWNKISVQSYFTLVRQGWSSWGGVWSERVFMYGNSGLGLSNVGATLACCWQRGEDNPISHGSRQCRHCYLWQYAGNLWPRPICRLYLSLRLYFYLWISKVSASERICHTYSIFSHWPTPCSVINRKWVRISVNEERCYRCNTETLHV